MRAYERFLRYIQFDTASDPSGKTTPSTEKQWVLARELVQELNELGAGNARVDERCYVYAEIPANVENQPAIGLIAHMDVVNEPACHPVHPSIVENYDGGEIRLENGDVISPAEYPGLRQRSGKSLIVTDGLTILGADDKAGVAEIMTACEKLLTDPSIPHGAIKIAFTPDEEIGLGADHFDVKGFRADFAYTVDGDDVGGIEYENFNAASAVVRVTGKGIHPGSAKGRMQNALLILMELNSMLPAGQTPADTEGYEGFFHLCGVKGSVEECGAHYIIRDHDRARFEERKQIFRDIERKLNEKYGEGTVEVKLVDSYYNMVEVLKEHMDVVHRAEEAYKKVGVRPFARPIRGGTDGSRLSFMGLPCPNLATGGMNFHGRHELIAIEDMDKMTDVLVALVTAQ